MNFLAMRNSPILWPACSERILISFQIKTRNHLVIEGVHTGISSSFCIDPCYMQDILCVRKRLWYSSCLCKSCAPRSLYALLSSNGIGTQKMHPSARRASLKWGKARSRLFLRHIAEPLIGSAKLTIPLQACCGLL